MPSIERPGVRVVQEFVTEDVTILTPTLTSCIIGPCFRIIDAFDDDGEPQDDALAGTYQDGNGLISYDVPSMGDEDDISGFEDDVRVFLVLGDAVTELNGEDDEEDITSGTGDFDVTGGSVERLFSDASATFEQVGVEVGDVVRLTYRDVSIDLPVTSVESDTELGLDTSVVDEDLTAVDYAVVRNQAEFVFDSSAEASVRIGSENDYLLFTAQATGNFPGSLGDGLSLALSAGTVFTEGTDGAVGENIFSSDAPATGFLAQVGAVGDSAGFLLFTGDPLVATNGLALRDVLAVGSDNLLIIESGEGVGTSVSAYVVGSDTGTGTDAVTNATFSLVTSATGGFDTAASATFIANTAGVPDTATYVEVEGDGVYKVASITDTVLTLDTATTGTGTGQNFTIITLVDSGADGATGGLDDFLSPSADFPTDVTAPGSSSLFIALSPDDAEAIADVATPVVGAHTDTTGVLMDLSTPFTTSGTGLTWKVVETTVALALSFDPDENVVEVQLVRAAGIVTSTFTEIEDAITNTLNAAHNATVFVETTAALAGDTGDGATIFIEEDLATVEYDGGSDDEQLILDADLIGSTTPVARVYVSWTALRLDVTDQAAQPATLEFESTSALDDSIGPISTDNPLALGLFFALLNSPTRSVKGLGVSDVSAAKPEGTLEAYTTAFEFLESSDVYGMVPLTQDAIIHQVLQTHVNAMSDPENKSERVALINQAFPSFATATTVAGGTSGNTGGTFTTASAAEFETSVDMAAAEVEAGDILVVTALASADDSPDAANGTQGPLFGLEVVSIKTGDDFTLIVDGTTALGDWDSLVDVSWSVYRPGAALTTKIAEKSAIADFGPAFEDRRVFMVWPDEVIADIDGTSLDMEGYYLAAGWAGKIGQDPPQQGFTEGAVTGYTGLRNSNNYFSNSQLNEIAGGGTFICIQESTNAPIKCRHQLSTDVSTKQRQEMSITKVLDFTARFFRLALTKQIGQFNITQSFLDSLATSVQGLGRNLVDRNVLLDFRLTSIGVNPDDPTQVDIIALVDVPFPVNYIELTLQV